MSPPNPTLNEKKIWPAADTHTFDNNHVTDKKV